MSSKKNIFLAFLACNLFLTPCKTQAKRNSPGFKALEEARKELAEKKKELAKYTKFTFKKGEDIGKKIEEFVRKYRKRMNEINSFWVKRLEGLEKKFTKDPAINIIRWELSQAYFNAGNSEKGKAVLELLGPSGLTLNEKMDIIQTLLNFGMEKKASVMVKGLDLSKLEGSSNLYKVLTILAAAGEKEKVLKALEEDFEGIEDGEEMWDVVKDIENNVLLMSSRLYRPLLALLYEECLRRFPDSDPGGGKKRELRAFRLKIGSKAVPLKGRDINGKPIDLSALEGKVVLLFFWGTWKKSCKAVIKELEALYKDYHGKGFEIIAVSLDRPASDAKAWVEKNRIKWFNICDGLGWKSPYVELYGVKQIPFNFLVDKQGKIEGIGLSIKTLKAKLKELL